MNDDVKKSLSDNASDNKGNGQTSSPRGPLGYLNLALNRLEEVLVCFLIAAATLIIFVQVLHRYLQAVDIVSFQDFIYDLDLDFTWAQELCILMFVWMAKFGAAYGVRTGIHVGVDVLINKLSGPSKRAFIAFGLLAGAFFTGTVAYISVGFVHAIYLEGSVTPDLEIPKWIAFLAMPVGTGLMCLRFLQVLFNFLKEGELPHHDAAAVEGIDDEDIIQRLVRSAGGK